LSLISRREVENVVKVYSKQIQLKKLKLYWGFSIAICS